MGAGWAVGRDPQDPRRPGGCSGGCVCARALDFVCEIHVNQEATLEK